MNFKKIISALISITIISQLSSTSIQQAIYANAYNDINLLQTENTIYISSSGSDSNNGFSEDKPLASFSAAYAKAQGETSIILLNDMTYADASSNYNADITFSGKTSSVKLSLPSEINLKGNLKLDNMTLSGQAATIYANGNSLEITDTVTSEQRLTVYGGSNGSTYTGNTDIKLYGGKYNNIYGGGKSSQVIGDTNVIIGGNVNAGDGTNDDDSSTISPCSVYGGGNGGAVSGAANVTMTGNAVTKFIFGAGIGNNGTAKQAYVTISGGNVMNAFGGSNGTTLTDFTSHVNMTGGMAEAIFGGSQNAAITGNTYVNLIGGEVTRRVYTGCYNEWDVVYQTKHYVTGTTTLSIYPAVKLNTKNGLSSDNSKNVGVFSGSRYSKVNAEVNTIIYLNGCYSSQKSNIGDESIIYGFIFKSNEKYVVNASSGGKVSGTSTGGKILLEPDFGKYASVNSSSYLNEEISISTGTTAVTFNDNFAVSAISANITDTGITVNTNFTSANVKGNETSYIVVGVYNSQGKMIATDKVLTSQQMTSNSFNLPCTHETGEYTIKAMIWNDFSKPLCNSKEIKINI